MDDMPILLSFDDLQKILKISRSTVIRWEHLGKFPKRINLGENSIAWRKDEIKEWLEKKSKLR